MCKKPKDELIKKDEPAEVSNATAVNDNDLDTDQRKRSYYYDDAHGYQKYVPDDDDESDEEE